MTKGRSADHNSFCSWAIWVSPGWVSTGNERRRVGDVGGFAEHVLGQRQDDRPRPARGRLMEGAGDDLGNAIGALDLLDPFGDLAEEMP